MNDVPNHPVADGIMEPKADYFSWLDYAAFCTMLTISTAIGIYHGFFSNRKHSSNQELNGGKAQHFLTANGQMSIIPVALSLLASFLSSVTLMGHPAEVYLYGSQIWLFGPSTFLIVPIVGHIMAPFFKKNNYVSAYQYFGDRFCRPLQFIASVLFSCQVVLFLALVVYAPSQAVHQATGLNITVVATVLYIICIFYTTAGGIKAVVWTDTFQIITIFLSLIAVIIKGTIEIGGISVVWERNNAFNRTTFFNWDLDVTERFTVWSTFIGSALGHIALHGGNQLQVQRYFVVPTVKDVQRMLWLNAVGWTILISITLYIGMLIFATYAGCDPLMTKRVTKADQLFPLYVMDTLSAYPGFRGLFMCSIFSAALSTMSTGMNSLSAVWYCELDGTEFKKRLSDTGASRLVKSLAFGFGIISYFCVFLVPHLGGLIVMNMTFLSICIGSIFGLFILGMVFPKANSVGATLGLISSILIILWITVGGSLSKEDGYQVDHRPLPSSVSHCDSPLSFNSTSELIAKEWGVDKPNAFFLYRISYLWYNGIAMGSCVIFGLIFSFISNFFTSGTQRQNVNKVVLPLVMESEHSAKMMPPSNL